MPACSACTAGRRYPQKFKIPQIIDPGRLKPRIILANLFKKQLPGEFPY